MSAEESVIYLDPRTLAQVHFNDRSRSSRDQCIAEFTEHDLHISWLVLDSAPNLAASCAVHGGSDHLLDGFSGRLRRFPFAGGRKVVRLSRLAGGDLLSSFGVAHFAGLRHLAPGDSDLSPGISTPVGSPPPDWPVDNADLALCFGHR